MKRWLEDHATLVVYGASAAILASVACHEAGLDRLSSLGLEILATAVTIELANGAGL